MGGKGGGEGLIHHTKCGDHRQERKTGGEVVMKEIPGRLVVVVLYQADRLNRGIWMKQSAIMRQRRHYPTL